jgi:alpha-D-ribose 1-methylphosphonate 5-triphosphate diphosphatase PhnM
VTSRPKTPEQSSLARSDYLEYQRQYYENNKEHLLEYAKIRYNVTRDEKAAYNASRKEARKQYTVDNIDSINAKRRERYHRNKQQMALAA